MIRQRQYPEHVVINQQIACICLGVFDLEESMTSSDMHRVYTSNRHLESHPGFSDTGTDPQTDGVSSRHYVELNLSQMVPALCMKQVPAKRCSMCHIFFRVKGLTH